MTALININRPAPNCASPVPLIAAQTFHFPSPPFFASQIAPPCPHLVAGSFRDEFQSKYQIILRYNDLNFLKC
ncbi:hypothetical protein J6590_037740 [Homalodisca vitripennis]|nr:hypothetical protein J6590_037740 [Homalodisca vitripennis]